MGKISDALDRIDYLEKTGVTDPRPEKEQAEVSISSEAGFSIDIEKHGKTFDVNGKWDNRLYKATHNNSKMAEAFSAMNSAILTPPSGKIIPKSIMVSSSTAKEGKSFITASLGVSYATNFDQPCVLIDCNFHHPTLALDFGINSKHGLVDYLIDQADITGLIKETSVPNLFVLPSGVVADKHSDLLGSSRMGDLIEIISRNYSDHTVVFDSPPLLLATESVALASQVDAIILVVRQGQAKKAEVKRFIDAVGEKKILGIVFNDLNSLN